MLCTDRHKVHVRRQNRPRTYKVSKMKKVLVVDDSKTIRTLCEMIYKGLEDTVLTADSAAAARQVIQNESPDVVFVDYTMPDEDAYEFVSSIKDKAAVVMLSGSYAPFDEAKAKSSGALAIVKKPFKTTAFFDAVDAASKAFKASSNASAEAPEAPQLTVDSAPVINISKSAVSSLSGLHSATSSSGLHAVSSNSGLHASTGSSGIHPAAGMGSGIHAAATSNSGLKSAPRRFNFPGVSQDSQPRMASPADMAATPAPAEHETPKTPVPSISPALQPEAGAASIDPALLRAEVIAAVKSMLPAIVNSYLKKLIQAEVKPQLQNWVDTRVEALVKKMQQ